METNNTILEKKDVLADSNPHKNALYENIPLIKDFIVNNFLFGDSGNLKNDTDLFQESIVDSTGILELISYIEITFKIKVNDDEIIQENFSSVNSINKYIQSKQITIQDRLCAE